MHSLVLSTMTRLLTFAFLLATALAAPVENYLDDDTCEPDWVNGSESVPSISSVAASTPGGTTISSLPSQSGVVTASNIMNTTSSAAGNSSIVYMPTRPDGSSGIPINNDHISAPVDTRPVPDGAAIYTPSGNTLNCSDLVAWMTVHRTANLPSKYLKITPGIYSYDLGTQHALDADANLSPGNNIVIYLFSGGWTFDFRDVTFLIDITPENEDRRPGNMIYINESDDLTILGGTIWIDQGEQFSQARVTDLTPPSSSSIQTATFVVEKGYNITAWKGAGPRNQGCVDSTSSTHYTRPPCNFWKVDNYDFSNLLSTSHSFTANVLPGSALQHNFVVYTQVGPNSRTAISSENNDNLFISGITTNGAFGQIGLNDKKTATVKGYYYVNPPAREGFARRVNGPTLSWGHIGEAFAYDTPGQEEVRYVDSWWQYTGCERDLQPGGNETLPVG